MYKEDLSWNNLQELICHKIQLTYNGCYAIKPNPTKQYVFDIYIYK